MSQGACGPSWQSSDTFPRIGSHLDTSRHRYPNFWGDGWIWLVRNGNIQVPRGPSGCSGAKGSLFVLPEMLDLLQWATGSRFSFQDCKETNVGMQSYHSQRKRIMYCTMYRMIKQADWSQWGLFGMSHGPFLCQSPSCRALWFLPEVLLWAQWLCASSEVCKVGAEAEVFNWHHCSDELMEAWKLIVSWIQNNGAKI